ncbi:ankyrin [Neurospora crassa]|nr:ankyrin [Neurospora crassa]
MSGLEGADAPVPNYSRIDDDRFMDFINGNSTHLTADLNMDIDLHLPLSQYPTPLPPAVDSAASSSKSSPINLDDPNSPYIQKERRDLQCKLIRIFFDAISSKKTDLVTKLITGGFVSPDVPNEYGLTPLLAAVEAGDGAMVCALLNLGADVNMFGTPSKRSSSSSSSKRKKEKVDSKPPADARTPLMAASAAGNLALAKLLFRDFHANDALIAGDGQLALRLAADNGHREIVDLLPSRRGGEFRRWRTHHAVATRRIMKAGQGIVAFCVYCVWYIPKAILWSLPKDLVVLPSVRLAKWSWKNKHQFGPWCKKQMKKMPERTKRAVQAAGRAAKALKHAPKGMARFAKALAKRMWWIIRGILRAMKVMCLWIWESLRKVGLATGFMFMKLVSAMHTAGMAVLSFFRNITLKDVGNGILVALGALFVDLPRAVFSGMGAFGKASYKALVHMLGFNCLSDGGVAPDRMQDNNTFKQISVLMVFHSVDG